MLTAKRTDMTNDYLHKEHPKTKALDDFWGQICRTVHGKPVSEDQIQMIVTAIKSGLQFEDDDVLLDLGCGNGALSRYFYDECIAFLGVDFSAYLIEVARNNFERPPDFVYREQDAATYTKTEEDPERFTKCLCYGCFAYFPAEDAETVLAQLSSRFVNVKTVLIGNLPDKARAANFYPKDKDFTALLEDNQSPVGIWRSKQEMTALANRTRWDIEFTTMPGNFYSAHYRYDAILRRQPS